MTTKTINQSIDDSEITITLPSYDDPGSLLGGLNGITSIDMNTITGSSYTWAQPYSSNYTISNGTSNTVVIDTDGLTMKNGCDIKVGDKSVLDTLSKIEERLAILHPNPKLEEKWENLRGLRKAYMDLEAEIIEKEKMWNILKKA